MNKKILLTSLMSIAMLTSIATGATYALFTAEDSANITVTAGKVAIEAKVDESTMKTYSFDWKDETGKTFENGGTAFYDSKTGILSLNNITPGDGINFDIKITNKSNVNIIYRIACGVVYDEDNPEGSKLLANALKATAKFNEAEMNFKAGNATSWTELKPESQTMIANINVELPNGDNQNDLQDQKVGLYFKVEAIQGNGYYEDAYVNNLEDFKEAINKKAEVVLLNDMVITDETVLNDANINLNGYRLLKSEDEVLDTYSVDSELTLKGLTYPITISGEGTFTLGDSNVNAYYDVIPEEVNTGTPALNLNAFTGKVVLEGENKLQGYLNGSAIYVSADSRLDLSGEGASLVAIGNNGADYISGTASAAYSSTTDESYAGKGGSAIEAEGEVYIHNLANLTAKGYGVHAFGIGGNTQNIRIENTTIDSIRGGFVNISQNSEDYFDASHNKSEPEGGAAIGSSYNGANITLNKVYIKEAYGGSKAAGIGATFHKAININITNSVIDAVYGGASSAGIGGSRYGEVSPSTQTVKIEIENSNITAYGGYFGAGIGSGYDTYVHVPNTFAITTINISGNSEITAFGGTQAAGIGTGYHAGGLAGTIANTVTVNATGGSSKKIGYTIPQGVGFGALDPEKDGKDNNSYIIYNGENVYVDFKNLLK